MKRRLGASSSHGLAKETRGLPPHSPFSGHRKPSAHRVLRFSPLSCWRTPENCKGSFPRPPHIRLALIPGPEPSHFVSGFRAPDAPAGEARSSRSSAPLVPQAPPHAQTHLLLRGRTLTATRTVAILQPHLRAADQFSGGIPDSKSKLSPFSRPPRPPRPPARPLATRAKHAPRGIPRPVLPVGG